LVWYKNLGASFFCFVIIHVFDKWRDGQTDRRTFRLWLRLPCTHGVL